MATRMAVLGHVPRACAVDFGRADRLHGSFGFSRHRCPGSNLARVELRIFLEEWLARIPDFRVEDEDGVKCEGGLTLTRSRLPLA